MRRTLRLGIACGCVILGSVGSAQAPPDKNSKADVGRIGPAVQKQQADLDAVGIGRYQLVVGEFSVSAGTESMKAIFKIDTKTGATWIYTADPKNPATGGTWKPVGR